MSALLDVPRLVGATSAGVATAAVVLAARRPRRRLAPRVRDYTAVARARLGTASGGTSVLALVDAPPAPATAVARIFGPPLRQVARSLEGAFGTATDAELRLRLRQAAVPVGPERFRYQQLATAAALAVAFSVLGLAARASSGLPLALVLVLGALGFVGGASAKRGEVDRRIRRRCEDLRAELYTVCQVMAVHARSTPAVVAVTRQVVARSRGEVAAELAETLAAIETGVQAEVAFARTAELTPEPAAARLYRTIATAAENGGDLADALLAQAADLRDARREEIKQQATKKRGAMIVPTVFFLASVMLLFIAAPLPRIVFGGFR